MGSLHTSSSLELKEQLMKEEEDGKIKSVVDNYNGYSVVAGGPGRMDMVIPLL